MNPTKIAARLAATFVAACIPNGAVGIALDVELWKAAAMSGAVAVLGVVQALAQSYRDGDLTIEEIEQAFGEK